MNKFKLNFYRFADYEENINVGITMDTSTLPSSARKVTSVMDDVSESILKVVQANEKLAVASSSAKTGMKTVAEGGIRRLNSGIGSIKSLAQSPFASDKFKVDAITKLSQLKNQGLDNLKIKNAGDLSGGQISKVMSAGGSVSNMALKETVKQEKELAKATKEAVNMLEKQYPVTDKVRAKLKELGLEAGKTATKTETFGQKMGKAFDKLKHYAVSWRIVYGVFQSIWNTLSDTFEKAAAYEEALNLYTVAMGEYAEAGSRWAERISSSLHLDPKQILQYTGAFYNLVQGLGVGSKAAYTMSTNLTQLAYDMSSYLNIDVESAHAKIQSAMTGQSRAVASAGIAMQQASLQELAYSLGIKKSVSEMTQAEKTYLRYIQIMRSTKNMQTDLARTIMTPENAVRILKQQFELLGRAIGQVFIPIVMAAIPYVMALTQILGDLANRLASLLGFQLTKINYDYSGLKEIDTAVEDTMDNIAGSAGSAAKSIGSSINRTLAAFDELNVVESESGGGGYPGSGGIGGAGSDMLDNLDKYITGYDMLEGLNDQLSEKTEKAKKNLQQLFSVLAPIAAIFAIWKGSKWVSGLIKFAEGAAKSYREGTGLMGVLKKLVTSTKDFFSGLGKVGQAISTVVGVISGAIMTFVGFKDMFAINWLSEETSNWTKVLKVLGDTLLVVGGLLLAFFVGGPIGLAVAAVAGIIGVVVGVNQSLHEVEDQMRMEIQRAEEMKKAIEDREYAMEHSFNNGGIHLGAFVSKFKEGIPPIEEFAGKISDVAAAVETADANTDETALAFLNLHHQIVMGTDDDKILEKLATATDKFKDSLKQSEEAHIKFHETVLDNLKQEGKITQEEYNERIDIVKKYYQQSTLYQSKYADEVSKLDTKLQNGQITQEEYNVALQKIMDKYNGLIPSTELLADSTGDLQLIMARKIDFGSFEEAEEQINDLKAAYQTADEQFKTSRKSIEDEYNATILALEKDNEILYNKLKDKSLSKAQREEYEAQIELNKQMLEQSKKSKDDQLAILDEQHTKMKAQYKNYLANILTQMIQNKLDQQEEAKETVKGVEEELRGLADIDLTQAGDDALGSYFNGMIISEEKARPKLRARLYDNGIDISDSLWSALRGDIPDQVNKTEDYWDKAWENPLDNMRKKAKEEGTELPSIYTTSAIDSLKKDGFKTYGKELENKFNEITNSVQKNLNDKPLSFKVSTNLNGSYNTILSGLQKFANSKWGPAINDILNSTANVFGGLKLGGLGNLISSKFKAISIKFFENGGYPTSGDLFFANENGRAEYITSLGNRTAVANQDQMIRAITDAILVGMQSIETGRGITQVYIGNEKVYEGQGTYQSRQADRYGTTYVKI